MIWELTIPALPAPASISKMINNASLIVLYIYIYIYTLVILNVENNMQPLICFCSILLLIFPTSDWMLLSGPSGAKSVQHNVCGF